MYYYIIYIIVAPITCTYERLLERFPVATLSFKKEKERMKASLPLAIQPMLAGSSYKLTQDLPDH